MRLVHTLALFALILAVSTGTAFLGYRYLTLASEYRERNLIHLNASHQALELISENPVPRPEMVYAIRAQVQLAREQARWCIDNLSSVETMAFRALGAGTALDICRADIATASRALTLTEPLLRTDTFLKSGPDGPFAQNLKVAHEIEKIRQNSLDFQPYVDIVERNISWVVKAGTALASIGLAAVFVLLSRQLVDGWRIQSRQTHELNRVTQRFSAAIAAATEGFAIYDQYNRLLVCNAKYRSLSHPDPDAIHPQMSLQDLMMDAARQDHYDLAGKTPGEFVRDCMQRLQKAGFHHSRQIALSGDCHILERSSVTDFGDRVFNRVEVTDIVRSEREQRAVAEALQDAKDKVERQSLTDPLTGLPNRRHLDLALQARLDGGSVTLIRLDLDRFKKVNDILGHEAGDFVLCHVAEVLSRHLGSDDLGARVGGDEFVILCGPGRRMDEAKVLSETLLEALLQPVMFGNKRCHYGASFGVACAEQGSKPSELLSNADDALYLAKESGRATVELFTPEMHDNAIRERGYADRMAQALEQGEIVPYFQTQHDAQTWDLVGVEVLARWEHPKEGLLFPGRFLPIVQQLGLEAELDRHIFQSAVKRIEELAEDGFILGRTGFNVSAARIIDPSFLPTVAAAIPSNRERFAFEILESISCEDGGEILDYAIDALKDLGFQIDVDDFGSGHASINGVMKIRPDALKIDRNIIMPLGQNLQAERMVSAVLDLARSLDVKVIAEGVDSRKKAEMLGEMGCDILQGFYFSRALEFQTLQTFVRQGARGPIAEQKATG